MRLLYSRHLEHFLAIYETGGLRQAAALRGVTQPALTRSLQLLESAFAVTLFERGANGAAPTQAGHILKRHAQHIVNSAAYAAMEIAAIKTGQAGRLRVGSGMIWGTTTMPSVLARLHEEFPHLEITLETGLGQPLLQRLLSGHLDVVLARMPTDPLPSGFSLVELAPTWNIVYSRGGHPLQKRRKVALQDLCTHEFVGFANDQEAVARSRTFFDGYGLPVPRVLLRVTSVEALLSVVAKSDCLAILPDMDIPELAALGLRRVRLAAPLWNVRVAVCYRTQIAEMAPMRALLDVVLGKRPVGASHNRPPSDTGNR
jgi:DNA-binding transcriptional LysR family regulator